MATVALFLVCLVATPPFTYGSTFVSGEDKTLLKAKGIPELFDSLSIVSLIRREPAHTAQEIDLTVGQEAGQILKSTPSGGLVSGPRKMATLNLALMALSVPGDFVETGVFNGGTAVLMAKVLKSKDSGRRLWAADSFEGLPEEDKTETAREHDQKHPDAAAIGGEVGNAAKVGSRGQMAAPRKTFENNLEANGLGNSTTNPQIKVLQGWFSETLPSAPIQQIAFLRLDGDIYASTMDALNSLYSKVVSGGYIYVDDYGAFTGCKHAVDEFRQQHGITEVMYPISECGSCAKFEALWWRKG